MRRYFTLMGLAAVTAALIAGCGSKEAGGSVQTAGGRASVSLKPVVTRDLDPMNGLSLFVDKGCVLCHSVNGVGGKAAPALDAPIGAPPVDPLDFAARMWRGAPAMIELQAIEMGYVIDLTADEIADLAAFAADRDAQKGLKPESLPVETRDGLLDQRFWEVENWDGELRRGLEDLPEGDPVAP